MTRGPGRPVVITAHGTETRANPRRNELCGCVECGAMRRASKTGVDHRTGRLLVQCWCRRDLVLVAPRVVKAGRTRTCGRTGCKDERGGP